MDRPSPHVAMNLELPHLDLEKIKQEEDAKRRRGNEEDKKGTRGGDFFDTLSRRFLWRRVIENRHVAVKCCSGEENDEPAHWFE